MTNQQNNQQSIPQVSEAEIDAVLEGIDLSVFDKHDPEAKPNKELDTLIQKQIQANRQKEKK